MLDRNVLKSWFKTKDKPTQSQFWQWIEACFFKGEKLPKSDVEGLTEDLNNLQLQINNNIPNQLISGGNVSIDTDDGTTLSVYLPETKYKLKGVPFTQAAGTFSLSLRPAAGFFRIDVFYLDTTGFHVVTGATSATPVKPGVPSGALELSNILIGFDNNLLIEPVPELPALSAVLAAGNVASEDIVIFPTPYRPAVGFIVGDTSSESIAMRNDTDEKGAIMYTDGAAVTKLKATQTTEERELYLPDKDGTLLVESDIATKADLIEGKVPASQLPSYVDDVIEGEYVNSTTFKVDGVAIAPESGKIYVDIVNLGGKTYRWSGSAFVLLSETTTKILSTIAALKAFSGEADAVIVTEVGRDGYFTKGSPSLVADDGIIVADATGNKWIRKVSDHINIGWYATPSDTGSVLDKIKALLTDATLKMPKRVFVPKGIWTFTAPYTVDFYLILYGAGIESNLFFPGNMKGFTFNVPNYTCQIQHLKIAAGSSNPTNTVPYYDGIPMTAHGVQVLYRIDMYDVTITNFAGNGLYIVASVPTSNANLSSFINCSFNSNKLHGVYLQGSDANACRFVNCDFSSNAGCGVLDKSFLGNHYISCHFATNGSPSIPWGARGYCTRAGKRYSCIAADPIIAIEPEVTSGWENYWREAPWPSDGYMKPYDATVTYIPTRSIFLKGLNQSGGTVQCYSEIDQIRGWIDQRNINIGGSLFPEGPSVIGDAASVRVSKELLIRNSDNQVDFRVSETPGTGIFYGYNGKGLRILFDKATYNTTIKTTDFNAVKIRLKQLIYDQGYFADTFNGTRYAQVGITDGMTGKGYIGEAPNWPFATIALRLSSAGYGLPSDVAIVKSAPTGMWTGESDPKETIRISGHAEYRRQTTDATPQYIDVVKVTGIVDGFVAIRLEVTAVDPSTGDMFLCKRTYVNKIVGNTQTRISTTTEYLYEDTGISGVVVDDYWWSQVGQSEFGGIKIVGLASKTLTWRIRATRFIPK